jgi:hypothetical protein
LADHEVPAVPAIKLFEWIQDGLADLDERRPDSQRAPIAQGTLADLAAVAFDDLFER